MTPYSRIERVPHAGSLSLTVTLAFMCSLLVSTPAAQAGCGCQKPPPELATVRPNATYAGTPVTFFSPSFQTGQAYYVDFISGTTSASRTVSATVISRRDLADGVFKPQLVVLLPDLPLGPTSMRVRNDSGTVLVVTDDAFTVAPPPIVVPQDPGTNTYPGFTAAIARDGTFYISLDMTGLTLPRVFEAQAKGYPLHFQQKDNAFYNTQGFLMQLLIDKKTKKPMPGMFVIPSAAPTTDSDLLHYSRHEFETYFIQHFERQPHQLDPTDPNWHIDGTRHVDHNHLILAIDGTLGGAVPTPGASPPFTLVFSCFSLFSQGLVGSNAISMSGSAATDAYAPGSVTAQPMGDVFTTGKLTLNNSATINGNATASSYGGSSTANINGTKTTLKSPVTFMSVILPVGLPDLGTINLNGSSMTIQGPGSFQVEDLTINTGSSVYIDNSSGPVTLYVTGQVAFKGGAINVANPDPEYFAIYVTGNNNVTLSSPAGFDGVLYAPASTVAISGSGEFFGSLVAKTLQASGTTKIHYDVGLRGAVPTPACAVNPNGTYIDAENFSGGANLGTTYAFAGVSSAQSGFVGTGYLQTGTTQNQLLYSDVNAAPGSYERYDYQLNFPTAGTYTVWMRGWGTDSNSNSLYIGLDGTAVGALTEWTYGNWVWTDAIYNGTNTITVTTPGVHTINLWPREYNHLLDGLYLTTTATVPSGGIPGGATVYGQGCSG